MTTQETYETWPGEVSILLLDPNSGINYLKALGITSSNFTVQKDEREVSNHDTGRFREYASTLISYNITFDEIVFALFSNGTEITDGLVTHDFMTSLKSRSDSVSWKWSNYKDGSREYSGKGFFTSGDLTDSLGETSMSKFGIRGSGEFFINKIDVAPRNVSVSPITANGASVTWVSGASGGNFRFEYGPTSFALGHGTKLDVNALTTDLSGLTSNTGYDIYIAEDFGHRNISKYTGPIAFTTLV